MKQVQHDVATFMVAAKQEIPSVPTIPLDSIVLMRARTVLEEAFEQVAAMGVHVELGQTAAIVTTIDPDTFNLRITGQPDLVGVADAICDGIYFGVGTALTFGIDLIPIWQIVQNANMRKFAPGHTFRPDGKLLKPPGWVAPEPEIRDELRRQIQTVTQNA